MVKAVYFLAVLIILIASILSTGCIDDKRDITQDTMLTKEIQIVNIQTTGSFKWCPYIVISSEPRIYEINGADYKLYQKASNLMNQNVTISYVCYYDPDSKEMVNEIVHINTGTPVSTPKCPCVNLC